MIHDINSLRERNWSRPLHADLALAFARGSGALLGSARPAAVVPGRSGRRAHQEGTASPTIVELSRRSHRYELVPAESLALLFAAADEDHLGGPVKIDLRTAAQALRLCGGAVAGDRYVGVRHRLHDRGEVFRKGDRIRGGQTIDARVAPGDDLAVA